jgi:hypothetical protein
MIKDMMLLYVLSRWRRPREEGSSGEESQAESTQNIDPMLLSLYGNYGYENCCDEVRAMKKTIDSMQRDIEEIKNIINNSLGKKRQ